MFTAFKRIIRSGFKNFWRNSVVSLASVFVITIALFVLGSLIFLQAALETTLAQLKEKVDINVYFATIAEEKDILSLKKTVEGLSDVAAVEYVSRDKALENFRKRHENDQLTIQALEELGDNPLGAVLNIRAVDPSHYENIANVLETAPALTKGGHSLVDKINYFQNKPAIDKLASIIRASEQFGFTAMLTLAGLSILITFNTIRLAIYTSRDEIAVMRLVGASSSYTRGPFVVEGVMAGSIAAALTIGFFYPLTYWLGPITENFFGGLNVFMYYRAHFTEIAAILMGSAVSLGAIASFMATKKYLKV